MPYLPEKKNWRVLPYQVPMVLMANEIFHSSGYSKFTTAVSPLTKPSQLNALKMDAPSFFSLFFSSKKGQNLDIFNYINNVIASRQISTENKDVVISSFFNMALIERIKENHNRNFAHWVTFLPGVKTVRLIGTRKNYPASGTIRPSKQSNTESLKRSDQYSIMYEQSVQVKSLENSSRLKLLQAKVLALDGLLKEALEDRRLNMYQKDITNSKKRQQSNTTKNWVDEKENNSIYSKHEISKDFYKSFEKFQNLQLHKDFPNETEDVMFSGTDYCFVKMTETSRSSMEK
ncbi:hypothetical protein INT47_003587 [Mucor saturninus]|uniref:Uncharacterized protein n=1 Tax=Mucor saturninus TaxID=64648 RepID=A0A8H7UX16_9FUNG|nr:hypothetical protein INT47_003587 [Mucor saturninus]